MKVLLAVHGYPPELVGGTELAVRRLAHALVRAGHDVVVFAGTLDWEKRGTVERTSDPVAGGGAVAVLRASRDDLWFDHWHKSRAPFVRRAFSEVLRSERPDVVHVHHWIRLSRDLVAAAARERVPAVVTLHDAYASCLVAFRIRPATRLACDAPLAVDPCIACASALEPPTPWMGEDEARRRFLEHRADLVRELRLARTVVAPTRSHAETVERGLGMQPGALRAAIVPPPLDLPEPVRDAPLFTGGVLRVGSWGHYAEHKGVDVLIDAVRAVRDPARVELRLAGGVVLPEYRRSLEERARGLQVVFDDEYGGEELASHRVTDVHVFASGSRAKESWGLVLDEALALGLPALLPDAGAFAERAHGAAWARLYAQGDAAALAALIDGVLDDPARHSAMRAAVPARSQLLRTGDDHAAALLPLYERAVAAGPPDAPPPFDDARDLDEQRSWDERVQRGGA
ncbi:MAG: glycosyltransferase [Planctomycetota bacterium]